ncbi:hypothetical protein JAAARDRAFT_206812 [Jaapia argillacea MUCL 33604]|uniref:Uncharacterized protein n=1 Tax=Jaapia argillacea MUCL 33604 TaxID=933084 RepID=A0A067PW42_9AGAM|nr:hypothetical protein JAAARDRAFT_206812 [Jaapia argillacea MUCL 33604]
MAGGRRGKLQVDFEHDGYDVSGGFFHFASISSLPPFPTLGSSPIFFWLGSPRLVPLRIMSPSQVPCFAHQSNPSRHPISICVYKSHCFSKSSPLLILPSRCFKCHFVPLVCARSSRSGSFDGRRGTADRLPIVARDNDPRSSRPQWVMGLDPTCLHFMARSACIDGFLLRTTCIHTSQRLWIISQATYKTGLESNTRIC